MHAVLNNYINIYILIEAEGEGERGKERGRARASKPANAARPLVSEDLAIFLALLTFFPILFRGSLCSTSYSPYT